MMLVRVVVCVLGVCAVLVAPGGCERSKPVPVERNKAEAAVRGHRLFIQICAQCHGMNGEGVDFMGARLIASDWVAERSNRELVAFLKEGRPAQADRPAMPPKGGRLDLTDRHLYDIVAFMRTLGADGAASVDDTSEGSMSDQPLPSEP